MSRLVIYGRLFGEKTCRDYDFQDSFDPASATGISYALFRHVTMKNRKTFITDTKTKLIRGEVCGR